MISLKTKSGAAGREKANEDGTTHELSGGFRKDAPPITIWRRMNGVLEVITGRHRLAHAKKNGEEFISVRVYDEDAAHDAAWAKLYDVEQNILDRQASALDVAYFFRNTQMTEAEAEARGLIARRKDGEQTATGTIGMAVARRACDDVYTAFVNGMISEKQAYFIATLGVEEQGQLLALKKLQDSKKGNSLEYVKAYVLEAQKQRAASDAPQEFNLFGEDESWAKEADKLARFVDGLRRQLHAQMSIMQGAGRLEKKGAAAEKLGIRVKTPADLQRALARMAMLDAALENMDADLSLGEQAALWDGKSTPNLSDARLMDYSAEQLASASLDIGSASLVYTDAEEGRFSPKMKAELNEIVAKAQAEGTYMLAPNGEPSKLTPIQWALARTRAFKEWFGDWEKVATFNAGIKKLEKMKPVASITGNEFAPTGKNDLVDRVAAYWQANYGGKIFSQLLGDVMLDKRSAKASIGHGVGRLKSAAFQAVPDVIKNGVLIDHSVNWKNRGYDTYVIAAPIFISGAEYVCETVITKSTNRTGFYLHEVQIKEKLLDVFKTGVDTGTPRALRSIIALNYDAVKDIEKNCSKIVDENGEPLVVYHGTMDGPFSVFDGSKSMKAGESRHTGTAFWFAKQESTAKMYAGWGGAGRVMPGFLRAMNPKVIDAKGKRWDDVKWAGNKGTQNIAERAKKKGYDAVIFRNIYDHSDFYHKNDLSDVVAVYDSTQIKSVENRGTFDAGNPDISMSLLVEEAAERTVAPYGKEAMMEQMVRSIRNAARVWRTTFAGRDPQEARDKAAEQMGRLMAMATGIYRVLPQGYRAGLDRLLRRGRVLAEMVESGRVLNYGRMSAEEMAALKEELEDARWNDNALETLANGMRLDMGGRMAVEYEFREGDVTEREVVKGGISARKAYAEANAQLVRELGEKKLTELQAEIAEKAAEQMARYLRDREVTKIARLVETYTLKKGKNGKLQRGKMDAESYRELKELVGMMNATEDVRADEIAALQGQIAEAERKGDMQRADELTARQMAWSTFGAIKQQSLENVRKARGVLMELLAERRTRWEAKQEDEKAQMEYMVDETVAGMGEADDTNLAKAREKERRASLWQRLKALPAYAQSIGQLFYGMGNVPGLGKLADETSRAITRGHIALAVRENELQAAMNEKLEELGYKSAADKADFMQRLRKVEDTGVVPEGEKVRWRVKMSVEDARRWVEMSKEERDAAREEVKQQEKKSRRKAANVPQEEDIPLMREELAKVDRNGGEKMNAAKRKQELTFDENGMSRDDAREAIKKLAGKPIRNEETLIEGYVNTKQRNKLLSAAAHDKSEANGFSWGEHNYVASRVDVLFRHATLVGEYEDKNGVADGAQALASVKRFACPIMLKGKQAVAFLTVKEGQESGHRIYSVELETIETLEGHINRIEDLLRGSPSSVAEGSVARVKGMFKTYFEDIAPQRVRKWVTVERDVQLAGKKRALRMNRDQALNLLLLCEQERYKQGNAERHGYTDKVLSKLREFVGEDVLEFGYWMRERLSRSGLAEVFEAREGVPFPAEENYWPGVSFDQSGRVNENVNALDPSSGQCSTRYSMLMLRVNHDLNFDLSVGATNAFLGAVAMTNNYICMGDITAKWRRMLGNARFARSLRQKVGESSFRAIKDGLNVLDGQGVAEAYAQKAVGGIIGMFQGAHAPAVLAGSVTTLVKQLSALMHGSGCEGVNAVSLMAQLLADRVGMGGRMSYAAGAFSSW